MSGTPDILLQIVADRAERVRRDGHGQGLEIPSERTAALVDFLKVGNLPEERAGHSSEEAAPRPGSNSSRAATALGPAGGHVPSILIAEVKRCSPSKGDIAAIPEPAVLAGRYQEAGFRRVSVLTEEARFGGSLVDLMDVKTAHPDLAVLRKDFLLDLEDVELSYRAGADAILLIATLLEASLLEAMHRRAGELGLSCLVEVHAEADVEKVRHLAPPLVGINSRDLRRFKVEPLLPLETRTFIDWPCDIVYESGISRREDALFVRGSGFSGFLVGEAVARSPELAAELCSAWADEEEARRRYGAWERLYTRFSPGRPLVKICGLTSRRDAEAAEEAGADLLGFVMAESPRRATAEIIRACADLPLPKVAVVVLEAGEEVPCEIKTLLEEGALDFIQFHGDETPETVRSWPSWKAVNLRTPEDAVTLDSAGSPAVLVDAFSPDARGGTGKRLDSELVAAASDRCRLWIAGGLNADNVGEIVSRYAPGLVDVSSGVAIDGGPVKNHDELRRFITEAKRMPRGASEVSKNE